MQNIQTIKIFLASSAELKADRDALRTFISVENDRLHKKSIYLELVQWEYFLDTLSPTRLQDEYNHALKECDLVLSLFFTKVGKFTSEEFEVALRQFQRTGKPMILTYFKDAPINMNEVSEQVNTLLEFKKHLKDLGHFPSHYKNIDDLKVQLKFQLEKIVDRLLWGEVHSSMIEKPPSPPKMSAPTSGSFPMDEIAEELEEMGEVESEDKVSTERPRPSATQKPMSVDSGSGGSSRGEEMATAAPEEVEESMDEMENKKEETGPQKGVILHSIPKKMQVNNVHRCIIRIAFNEKLVVENLSDLATDRVIKTGVRISESMEVVFDESEFFEVNPINSAKQLIDKFEATEWNFDVKPLQIGRYPLNFRISIILANGKKEVVLTESVQVSTESVDATLTFVPANLKPAQPKVSFDKTEIQQMIAKGELAEALAKLTAIAPEKLLSEVFMLQGRLTNLERQERMNLISFDNAKMSRAKITDATLKLVDLISDVLIST